LGVPDAYFFNSKGELLETGSKGTDCSVAINRLDKIYKCKSDSHQLLQNFLDDIQIQDDKKFIADNVDIYVIITWAKFLSSESETSFSWFSHLKGEQKYSIKVLLLNLDVQESWNLSEKQKKYLGVN
jgi:hypothetical protein